MTVTPPPPTLTVRSYQAGDMACLATPPSWEAPLVRFKKNTDVTGYNGFAKEDVDFIWPAWNESLDYSSASDPIDPEKPRVWLVWYDGVLWYPTLWYSEAHIGKPPTEAKSQIGQPAGYRSIHEYNDPVVPTQKYTKSKLVNRGGPIRVWLRVPSGAEEELSHYYWTRQTDLGRQVAIYPVNSIYDYCDRPLQVVPFHTMPVRDADPPRWTIYQNYFPGVGFNGYKIESAAGQDPAGKYVNTFATPDSVIKPGQNSPFIPTVFDTPGWDPVTGDIQSKIRGLERSPYYIDRQMFFTDGQLGPKDYYDYELFTAGFSDDANGSSYTLWQKKATTSYLTESKTYVSGKVSNTFPRAITQGTISDESPPVGRMMLAHPNPIPGYAGFYASPVTSITSAPFGFFDGGYWFADNRRSSVAPFEPVQDVTMVGSRVGTITGDRVIVSTPIHPAFAKRAVQIKLLEANQNATVNSYKGGGSNISTITYSVSTKFWVNSDAQKILYVYPFLPFSKTHIGTPTEVPEKPLSIESQKVVSSYQVYTYSYFEEWPSESSYKSQSTLIVRPSEVFTSAYSPD